MILYIGSLSSLLGTQLLVQVTGNELILLSIPVLKESQFKIKWGKTSCLVPEKKTFLSEKSFFLSESQVSQKIAGGPWCNFYQNFQKGTETKRKAKERKL